jgi:uncharacterized protein
MSNIKELITSEWNDRQNFIVFTTVNKDSVPNSVYIGFASLYDNDTLLLADNKLSKTKENILSGCNGSVLFITSKKKAYQIKGSMSYQKEGKFFDDMKKWNREDLPGHGVAVLNIEEIYSGAEKLF